MKKFNKKEYDKNYYQEHREELSKRGIRNMKGANGNWHQTAQNKKFIRDLFVLCERCFSQDKMEVHHVIPIGMKGSSDSVTNMVLLCKSCHQTLHGMLHSCRYEDYAEEIKKIMFNRSPEEIEKVKRYDELDKSSSNLVDILVDESTNLLTFYEKMREEEKEEKNI